MPPNYLCSTPLKIFNLNLNIRKQFDKLDCGPLYKIVISNSSSINIMQQKIRQNYKRLERQDNNIKYYS